MASKDSGPKAGVEGIVEDVKGKVKQVIGEITGNEGLEPRRWRASKTRPRPSGRWPSARRRPTRPAARRTFTRRSSAFTSRRRTTTSAVTMNVVP